MYNVLVCDDEQDIVAALRVYLSAEGYSVLAAANGREALDILAANEVHLVLMDIMMPGMDGITAMSRLRENSNIPVILLTAKGEDTDKVLGLNVGADDYVVKPFNPVELLARVKAQLRRYVDLGGKPAGTDGESSISVGPIRLDDDAKQVFVNGTGIALTPTEYDILRLLMRNPGKVFSSKQIYSAVWQDPAYGAENTVAVHIRHLREKIEINPAEPRWLKVVWGQGYKLEGGKTIHV